MYMNNSVRKRSKIYCTSRFRYQTFPKTHPPLSGLRCWRSNLHTLVKQLLTKSHIESIAFEHLLDHTRKGFVKKMFCPTVRLINNIIIHYLRFSTSLLSSM